MTFLKNLFASRKVFAILLDIDKDRSCHIIKMGRDCAVNKYKSLALNTLIFTIGTFSSKILVFILVPIYTNALSKSEFSTGDLLIQIANLLIPFVTLGITNSIIRFGLDKNYNNKDVFSTGIYVVLVGSFFMVIATPFLSLNKTISQYAYLLCIFTLVSSYKLLCNQFVRAKGNIALFALDGFLSTLLTLIFTILFLIVFEWGVTGYLMATICSDIITGLFLFFVDHLYRYVKWEKIRRSTAKAMVKYAVPMIPNTISWWIINVSDRYLVNEMLGGDINGLYAIAYKVPSMIVLISGIFMDAWQVSAFDNTSPREQERFFSIICNAYQTLIFLASSGLIIFSKIMTMILTSRAFYESWRYIPLLIMSTIFSCLVTFLGSIYMVEKKSNMILLTTIMGAVVNVVLNLILIPIFGANGAGFSTFVSYFIIFVFRAVHTQRMIRIHWNVPLLVVNLAIISLQSYVMVQEVSHWIMIEIVLLFVLVIVNMKMILINVNRILRAVFRRKKKRAR